MPNRINMLSTSDRLPTQRTPEAFAPDEQAVVFDCEGESLLGVLHQPAQSGDTAVLVVVGGPQYRVGSHRQFLLLARHLAAAGIPVLRFDYRGMGDSSGAVRDFEAVQADIQGAVDYLAKSCPQIHRVVIWGLCDAASAACFYAATDSRIHGLVLLNPWVRTESGIAKAYLRHYYFKRLFSLELWNKLFSGKFDIAGSLKSLKGFIKSATISAAASTTAVTDQAAPVMTSAVPLPPSVRESLPPLPERMYNGLKAFSGKTLIILSGDDLTADEFRDLVKQSRAWKRLLANPRISTRELSAANHTFAKREWRDQVARWTLEWINSNTEFFTRKSSGHDE